MTAPLSTRVAAACASVRDDPLVRNSSYIMAATVVGSALGYLYWLAADRLYPIHAVGLGTALVSAMTLASLVSNPALHSLVVQVLPGRASGRDWSVTVSAALAAAVVTGTLAGVAALAVLAASSPAYRGVTGDPLEVAAFCAGVASWTVAMVVDYLCVGERSAGPMLARAALFGVGKLGLLLLPVALGTPRSSVAILVSWSLANLASCAWVVLGPMRRLGRGSGLTGRGLLGEARRLAHLVTGHHLANLGAMLPMYALPIEVAARLPLADTAWFYTTWMVAGVFFMVSPAVSSSLFAEGTHAEEHLGATARRALRTVLALLAVPMAAFLAFGREVLASFGSGFASHGGLLLTLLVVSAVPDAVTNVWVSVLRVRRRLAAAAGLNLAMAAVTMAAAWWALPSVGIAAIGASWLAAQCAGAAWVGLDALRGRARPAPDPWHGPTSDLEAGLGGIIEPVLGGR